MPDELEFQEIEESRSHAIIHDQMISNVVQIGKIVKPEKDDPKKPPKKACVLVHIGGEEKGSFTRNWMSWVSSRAGYDAEWWMPEIDEQVVIVAPSGNLALGIIIGMIFRGDWLCLKTKDSDDAEPQFAEKIPSDEQVHIHRKLYEDGSGFSYDRKKHALSIELKEKQDGKKSGVLISSLVNEKKGELKIKLGEEEKEQTVFDLKTGTAEITVPQGIKFIVGESVIEMKEDTITLKQGESVVDIKKDKITLKSKNIELDAGSKLTVSKSGADVT